MDAKQLKKLGVENPDEPVTKGELTAYVWKVIQAERERLAVVYSEAHADGAHWQDTAVEIRVGSDEVLSWT